MKNGKREKKTEKTKAGMQSEQMELVGIIKCSHVGYDSFSNMPCLFYKTGPCSITLTAGFSPNKKSTSFKKILKLQEKFGEFMVPGPFWISLWKRNVHTATGPMEDQHVEHIEVSLDDMFGRLKDRKKNSVSPFMKIKI